MVRVSRQALGEVGAIHPLAADGPAQDARAAADRDDGG